MSSRVITIELQVVMICGAIAMYAYVIYKIRKSNVRIDDMILWIISSVILLIISLFPIIPAKLATLIGFMTTSNFIISALIFFLLLVVFSLSIKFSQQHEKLKDMAHRLAILEKKLHENHQIDKEYPKRNI